MMLLSLNGLYRIQGLNADTFFGHGRLDRCPSGSEILTLSVQLKTRNNKNQTMLLHF